MPVAEEGLVMRGGSFKGWKIRVLGLATLVLSLLGPGVATVSAKPAAMQLTVLKRAAVPAVVAPAAVAPAVAAPAAPAADVAPLVSKRRLRRVKQHELNTTLMLASAEVIKKHHAKRFGTEIELEIVGKRYVARIERHFHPEGGAVKPWGHHPGVSLFSVQ